jgi:glucokinase
MRIGIDVGASKLAFGVADAAGSLRMRHRVAWVPSGNAQRDFDAIAAGAEALLAQAGVGRGELRAIGVCAPGPLDAGAGVVEGPPNLPGWNRVPLCALLERALGAPAALENDANAQAFAEWQARAGQGVERLVYLTMSTGVGAGIVLGGRLERGAGGLGGELGHVAVEWNGERCACGMQGCLEVYAGGAAWQRHLRRVTPPSSRAAALAGSAGAVRPEHVVAAAREGDAFARAELERWNGYVARALAAIAIGLAPDVIALGTIASAAGEALCLEPLRRRLRERVWPRIAERVRIEASALGDELPVLAALIVAERAVR